MKALRRVGWLDSKWSESPAGPPRRYYRLTPEGGRRLRHLADRWRALMMVMHHRAGERR